LQTSNCKWTTALTMLVSL